MQELEYRIAKLALGPYDVLVVKLDQEPTPEHAAQLARHIGGAVGRPVRTLVVPPGIDLEVLTAADIEDRLARGGQS